MSANVMFDELEETFEVRTRVLGATPRPPRRYSPRFEKKRSGEHNGVHRRGSRRLQHAR